MRRAGKIGLIAAAAWLVMAPPAGRRMEAAQTLSTQANTRAARAARPWFVEPGLIVLLGSALLGSVGALRRKAAGE